MGVRGCRCSPEAMRIMLWMAWVTNLLITTIYYVMSFATFYKLLQASGESQISTTQVWLNQIWRAPLAASLLGGLLVLGFNLFSCIIMIKKSVNRSGPGFGYGFMVAFCFTLSFFLLLVALVLDSFQENIKLKLQGLTSWTKYSTELYIGTEVFAAICAAMLMFFFLALVVFQSAVSDQLGISKDMNNPYAPMGDETGIALATNPMAMSGLGGSAAKSASEYGGYTAPQIADDANYTPYYAAPQGYQPPASQAYQNAGGYMYQDQDQAYTGQYGAQAGAPAYQAPLQPGSGTPSATGDAYTPPAPQYSPPPPTSDFHAAAMFHGQQGAFAGQQPPPYVAPGVGAAPGMHQQV